MTVQSTAHSEFQETVASWISSNGEVLGFLRFHAGAGSREYELFRSLEDFNKRLSELPPRTSVIVFGERQLPLRGKVDNEFISTALRSMADGADWLLLRLTRTTAGSQSWHHWVCDDSLEKLESELRDDYF